MIKREPIEDNRKQDMRFFNHICFEIISYATVNGREPVVTLQLAAERILRLLKIVGFEDDVQADNAVAERSADD